MIAAAGDLHGGELVGVRGGFSLSYVNRRTRASSMHIGVPAKH